MDVENEVNEGIGAQKSESAVASATVPRDSLGAETNVIAEQQWRAIHEQRAAGVNVSQIARELDLDRKTVRSALKRRAWQPYRRRASSGTLLEAHRDWSAQRAPRVHYSARILYQELRHERGFTGCYEIGVDPFQWTHESHTGRSQLWGKPRRDTHRSFAGRWSNCTGLADRCASSPRSSAARRGRSEPGLRKLRATKAAVTAV